MSKRTKIILIIAAIVIIGLVVAIVLLGDQGNNQPVTENPEENRQEDLDLDKLVNLPVNDQELISQAPRISSTENTLNRLVRNFSERYGSFSSDSGFTNVEEVKLYATASFQSELEAEINQGSSRTGFYQISAKLMKVDYLNLDEAGGTAEVRATLQREEAREGAANFVFYQDILLSLIRSGQTWLVDSAEWQ